LVCSSVHSLQSQSVRGISTRYRVDIEISQIGNNGAEFKNCLPVLCRLCYPCPMKILVIEDQQDIADLVALHLRDLGHEVNCVHDGQDGLAAALDASHDLIVLDLMLPRMNGLEILKTVRKESINTPILMLTARSSELDRVLGLELGADDYLTKPFSIAELQARVKAIFRRQELTRQNAEKSASSSPLASEAPMAFDELNINPLTREAFLAGVNLNLTAKEFELLLHFAKNPGRAYTRMQLLDAVWSTTFEGYEHNVNTHINRLRNKIEKDPANPKFVLTVRGVGYRFQSA
jgi:DNA-binding response OmpR family regulator